MSAVRNCLFSGGRWAAAHPLLTLSREVAFFLACVCVCVWRFSLNVAGDDKPTNPCYQCLQSVEVGGGER